LESIKFNNQNVKKYYSIKVSFACEDKILTDTLEITSGLTIAL